MHIKRITRDPGDDVGRNTAQARPFYVKLILCLNATSIVDDTSCSSTQQSSEQVEQLYCICRNVEEGLMVGCDNNDCPYECFHVGCVGLDCIPQGERYCADLCQSNQLNLIKL